MAKKRALVKTLVRNDRRCLLRQMAGRTGADPVPVSFANDDVPEYLRKLDEFAKASKKVRVLVK